MKDDSQYLKVSIKGMMSPHTVARMVRGYTMGAIQDGWLVFYDELDRPPTEAILGELCVVKLADGRGLIRFVKAGRLPGRYDLLSVTGEPILDAQLLWAEPVTAIRPHKPTAEEIAMIEGLNI